MGGKGTLKANLSGRSVRVLALLCLSKSALLGDVMMEFEWLYSG